LDGCSIFGDPCGPGARRRPVVARFDAPDAVAYASTVLSPARGGSTMKPAFVTSSTDLV